MTLARDPAFPKLDVVFLQLSELFFVAIALIKCRNGLNYVKREESPRRSTKSSRKTSHSDRCQHAESLKTIVLYHGVFPKFQLPQQNYHNAFICIRGQLQ